MNAMSGIWRNQWFNRKLQECAYVEGQGNEGKGKETKGSEGKGRRAKE
jgi:hypothetical protein